jgi:hypothetical protein
MPFTVIDCRATSTTSIELTFSASVNEGGPPPGNHDGNNLHNYRISARGLNSHNTKVATVSKHGKTVTLTPDGSFHPGEWISVLVHNVRGRSRSGKFDLELDGPVLVNAQLPGAPVDQAARTTKSVEDAVSYPILTESFSPRSLGSGQSSGSGSYVNGANGLGQSATLAISDVLGWKANSSDAKGFLSALTQSFSLNEVEGHIQSQWKQRSYTVQSDLGGSITGAQASLYARAQDVQQACSPLLDSLYPLDPNADPEYVNALREMARSQIAEIVKQFGTVPPSILRVNKYFQILLGSEVFSQSSSSEATPRIVHHIQPDPDLVGGTLGEIRKMYGIYFTHNGKDNPYSNTVEAEQDITNFRMISDNLTSLLLTWLSNRKFFELQVNQLPAFFGTQLVLISRQLNVIAETVEEVRFALNSVFIGPNERQTLLLVFHDHRLLPAMYLEDILNEIVFSVSDEIPRLLNDGGRIAVNNNVLPVMQTLMNMIEGARDPKNIDDLPDGFRTMRVRRTLDDLRDQLIQLFAQGQKVGINVPQPLPSLIAVTA